MTLPSGGFPQRGQQRLIGRLDVAGGLVQRLAQPAQGHRLCPVFHTRIEGVPVAGAQADVLAGVAGAGIDEQALAVRVACGPKLSPPVGGLSVWRGVRALASDHYLRIDPDGTVSELRWWRPPEPELPLSVGAGAVREALEAAVSVRRPVAGRLSADLSGGMVSTSLCFLAARAGNPDLVAFRWAEADVTNDDATFAAHAASGLSPAEHVVLGQTEMPTIFPDAQDSGDIEAPCRLTRTLAGERRSITLLAAHGPRYHLVGHGSDELFSSSAAYLHSLLRRRPITAFAHVRGCQALHCWSWAATVSGLAHCGHLGAWWRLQARQLTAGPLPRRTACMGWGRPLRAPARVTPAAADATRAVLHAAGDAAQPLAADCGDHVILSILRIMGLAYRQLRRLFSAAGLRVELPYFDDRVIEAALGVRPHECASPWQHKPLLVGAMRRLLPEVIAARITKADSCKDLRVGLHRHPARDPGDHRRLRAGHLRSDQPRAAASPDRLCRDVRVGKLAGLRELVARRPDISYPKEDQCLCG